MQLKKTIRNCPIKMKFECPRSWESLTPTDHQHVRHCERCGEDVHSCSTDEETLRHARAGHCIARAEPEKSPRVVVGRPEVPENPEDQRLRERWRRERGIDWLLDGRLGYTSRDCPACGYPVPTFRQECKVCGTTSTARNE